MDRVEALTESGSTELLVERLKNREESALQEVMKLYGRAVAGVINKIIDETELTEELVQETFLKVWINVANYDESKGRLFTWIISIARNLAIDKTRSAGFKLKAKTEGADKLVYVEKQGGEMNQQLDQISVRDAVATLRPEQKELIDLIYFYGYTQAEVSEKLKIPLGTVKTRVRASIKELRKIFAGAL